MNPNPITPAPPPQIGGLHYSSHEGVQPIELIESMDLGFHAGNAIKYVARFKHTQAPDDLLKAIWYIERLLTITQPAPQDGTETDESAARRFAKEIQRLHDGLLERGYKILPGLPIDEAPVTSALHYLTIIK